ncbi:MOSC domain-containing protein [soil metagenome]
MGYRLLSVNLSTATPLLATGPTVMSAIAKNAVTGQVKVNQLGLEGDERADADVHGGVSKAIYAYPREHYPHWQTMRAQAQASSWNEALPNGFMGENLTLEGLLENQVWIGDVIQFPNCQLAVSEPRTPCAGFNEAMGFPQASKMMLQSGWCGYYLAVRVPGSIAAGDEFELIPGPRHIGIPERFRSLTGHKR